jgi:hypothetical protein
VENVNFHRQESSAVGMIWRKYVVVLQVDESGEAGHLFGEASPSVKRVTLGRFLATLT